MNLANALSACPGARLIEVLGRLANHLTEAGKGSPT